MVIGHLFLLGASLAWAIAIIVVRGARPRQSMFALLPWCFALASLALLPLVLWDGAARPIRARAGGVGCNGLYWRPRRSGGHMVHHGGDGAAADDGDVRRIPGNAGGRAGAVQPRAGRGIHAGTAGRLGADPGQRRDCRLAGAAGDDPAREPRAGRRAIGRRSCCCTACSDRRAISARCSARVAAKRRVIALDLRNHGDSPHAAGDGLRHHGRRCDRDAGCDGRAAVRAGRALDGGQGGDAGRADLAGERGAVAGVGHRAGGLRRGLGRLRDGDGGAAADRGPDARGGRCVHGADGDRQVGACVSVAEPRVR